MATRDTLPPPSSLSDDHPSSSTTSTTISKLLPSFHDNDVSARLDAVFQPVGALIAFSLIMAVGMVAWEDYAVVNLWPSKRVVMMASTSSSTSSSSAPSVVGTNTVRGLGFGKEDRIRILEAQEDEKASLLPEIRAYNEVMQEHNMERVARWRQSTKPKEDDNNKQLAIAVTDLQQILLQVLEMQSMVTEYKWNQVHTTIQNSIVPKLEPAATVLRQQLTDDSLNGYNVGYEEIGFDWGSCAWRHCGALADAQEALDELDHLLGVLEPPECLFCLDVVERSIRDMLAVAPINGLDGIPNYIPYQSAHAGSGGDMEDDGEGVLDQEYLNMLQELRSTGASEDVDDE